MFENWSEVKLDKPQNVRLNDMSDLYQQYCEVIKKAYETGDVQMALGAR